MAVTYSIGKDATITGVTNNAVRSVTATIEGSQIDVTKRGDTSRKFKAGFKEATIEIEMLESPPASGTELSITHDASGISGTMIVTSVTRNEPLDDAVSFSVTCKMKTAPAA
jgi:hypothetical protein